MSSSPPRSPSPPTTNLPFQPQISPYTQGSQSNPSNYPWPQPSTYNPSIPLPNGPYSIPPDQSLLRPAAQQPQPQPQSSSRPNVDPPPMKPPTDDQLWKLVQYYLYSSNELRSPVVYTSSLVIIFGFDDKVTAESLAKTIRSFSIKNHNTGEKEYPYEKTLVRTCESNGLEFRRLTTTDFDLFVSPFFPFLRAHQIETAKRRDLFRWYIEVYKHQAFRFDLFITFGLFLEIRLRFLRQTFVGLFFLQRFQFRKWLRSQTTFESLLQDQDGKSFESFRQIRTRR